MEEIPKISVSTQCKVCLKDFTISTIFKHVSHSTTCQAGYSNYEIQAFKTWKKERDDLIKKPNHDPIKRRERYLRQKEKKFSISLNQEDQTECSSSGPVMVSTLCKGCKVLFNSVTIFKHISHSKSCKTIYSDKEIREYEKWANERRNQAKSLKHKSSYDPLKRAQLYQQNKEKIAKIYHEKISKFKEKPKDRASLKGQSFVKIFNKAYDEGCDKFYEQLCKKAHQFLIDNFLNDIKEQTLKYTLWGKTVEENLIRIAKYIANNSWENEFQPEFQIKARLYGKFKDAVYKEAFANFFHNESFLFIYNKCYDQCLDHIMTSDPETFFSGLSTVEKRCNKLFEMRLLENIVAESKESLVKTMSNFIKNEIEQVLEIDDKKQNVWRRWLEHNQQSWGKILNVSGHTLTC